MPGTALSPEQVQQEPLWRPSRPGDSWGRQGDRLRAHAVHSFRLGKSILRHRPLSTSPQVLGTGGNKLGQPQSHPAHPHPPSGPPSSINCNQFSLCQQHSLQRGCLSSHLGLALLSCVNPGRLFASLHLSLLVLKRGCHLLQGRQEGLTEEL